jgi:crossover junction endodeoxyribonuclease RuvC
MKLVAFDLSLTESGVAAHQVGSAPQLGTITPGNRRGMDRLAYIRRQVLLQARGSDLVIIEGYSYGAKGSAVLNIAEMGGVVRLASLPVLEVPPSVLKKLATGKGNAKKEEVLAAAIRRLGYDGANHNVADARWLLEIGLHLVGQPTVQLPRVQLDSIAKLAIPCAPNAARPLIQTPAGA